MDQLVFELLEPSDKALVKYALEDLKTFVQQICSDKQTPANRVSSEREIQSSNNEREYSVHLYSYEYLQTQT